MLSPSPQRPKYSGLGARRPPGKSGPQVTSPVPARKLAATDGWTYAPQLIDALHGGLPPHQGFDFARATSISLRTTVTRYCASHSYAVVRMSRLGFNPIKAKQSKELFKTFIKHTHVGWYAQLSYILSSFHFPILHPLISHLSLWA